MGNRTRRWGLRRRPRGGERPVDLPAARTPAERMDAGLIIAAARLVVSTRLASRTLLIRRLAVTEQVADALLAQLEHCAVIAPAAPDERHQVLTTTGQLPGLIADVERCH